MRVLDALAVVEGKSDVLVTLDFETYYAKDYQLRTMTTESYVRDPRFEVIGVGVKFGSAPSVWMEEEDFREWAARVDWSRVSMAAHHAHFDGLILSHHYDVRPHFWLCTLSLGRALHGLDVGGSLAKLATHYGIGAKGDEVLNALGKHREDFTPEEWERYGAYCNNDVELTYSALHKMVAGYPLSELWLVDTTIRWFTEPVFVANQDVLARALADERAKKAEMLRRCGATPETLGSNDKFAALLRAQGVDPPTKISTKTGKLGYAFAKTDPGMTALLEHPEEAVRFLAEARLSVKSNIVESRTERIIEIAKRGPVPFYLKYCGAHTHRWSGGDKMNPQNFNRGGVIRDAMEAPEGHALVVADSGQIEARVLPWVAGESALLDTFRRNDAMGVDERGEPRGDFYSDEGTRYFKKKVSKKETPVERQNAKSMVLGLGFQMGVFKFGAELLKGMLGAKPVQFTKADAAQFKVDVPRFIARAKEEHGDQETLHDRIANAPARIPLEARLIHWAVTDYLVRLYRETNSKIAKLWERLGNMLPIMARPGGDPHEVRATLGCLKFIPNGVVKPNGMIMHYPGLRRERRGFTYLDDDHKRKHIYGGLLTENVVQSLARDIVAEQALWVRARGYRIATTTHDEIVAVVPEAQAQECLAHMLTRMKIAPDWCADLPLNASGGIARSYGEAK